ncbi:hypothetical protein AWB75_05273 [Caballeronia catudaia]|uniref:Uncharacterized protein n=1 Tax=Caballeronia catudaia TaxID=1777136 RepID=A0A158CJR8_9BURK|nr:hypothetical protein AWB75_05273 [Caballeronia catudaia]
MLRYCARADPRRSAGLASAPRSENDFIVAVLCYSKLLKAARI